MAFEVFCSEKSARFLARARTIVALLASVDALLAGAGSVKGVTFSAFAPDPSVDALRTRLGLLGGVFAVASQEPEHGRDISGKSQGKRGRAGLHRDRNPRWCLGARRARTDADPARHRKQRRRLIAPLDPSLFGETV